MESRRFWMDLWGRIFTLQATQFDAASHGFLTALQPSVIPTEDFWIGNPGRAFRTVSPGLKIQQEQVDNGANHSNLLQNHYDQIQNPISMIFGTLPEQPTATSIKQEQLHTEKQPKREQPLNPDYSEDSSSSASSYLENEDKPNQQGERKRTSWKTVCSRRESLSMFRKIIHNAEPTRSPEQIIRQYELELSARIKNDIKLIYGKFNDQLLSTELALARKSQTHHFIKILRLTIEILRGQEDSVLHKQRLDRVKAFLNSSPPRISSLLDLYRRPDFRFYVDQLKEQVLIEGKLPALIMALNIKSTEKIVMLPLVSSYIHALHYPEVHIRSWKPEEIRKDTDTSSIARDVREQDISYEEVLTRVKEAHQRKLIQKPHKQQRSKFSNLSYRFKTLLIKIAGKALKSVQSQEERTELEKVNNRVPTSMEGVRLMLRVQPLRKYLLEVSVPTKQLIIEILEDPTIDIDSKTPMMECYPILLKAIEEPDSLKSWQTDDN